VVEQRKLATKKKVKFIDLARPPNYSFYPLNFRQAFEVFRWMVKTGSPSNGYYSGGRQNVYDILSKTSGINSREVRAFTGKDWARDLKERFQWAVLLDEGSDPNGHLKRWRENEGISLTGERVIPISYFNHGGVQDTLLTSMLTTTGRTRQSHNSCWKKARTVYNVCLVPSAEAWSLKFYYGFSRDRSSSWDLNVARQEEGEVFDDFFRRAYSVLNELVERD